MRRKKLQQSKVIGCIPLDKDSACFAVPVFAHPDDPARLAIQEIDELTGKVCGFRVLEHPKSQLIHVADNSSVAIGEEQLYAFVAANDSIIVGTLASLHTALEQFADANTSRHGLTCKSEN